MFRTVKRMVRDLWNSLTRLDKRRTRALDVADSRLSEDGSPTHSHELVKEVGKKRLEPNPLFAGKKIRVSH